MRLPEPPPIPEVPESPPMPELPESPPMPEVPEPPPIPEVSESPPMPEVPEPPPVLRGRGGKGRAGRPSKVKRIIVQSFFLYIHKKLNS